MARSENSVLEQRGKIVGMEFPLPVQGYRVSVVSAPELIEDATPRARLRGAVEFYNRRTKRMESVFVGLTVFGSAASVVAKYAEVGGQILVEVNDTFSIGVPVGDDGTPALGKQLYFDMSANTVHLLRSSSRNGGSTNGAADAGEEADVEF